MPSTRPRLLVAATSLRPPGGALGVAAWALQALCEEWEITLLAWHEPDFDALNRHYGTRLDRSRFRIIQAPAPLRGLVGLDRDPYSFQPSCLMMRWCRWFGNGYDLYLSLNNEFDFGRPGIHYIHYPYLEAHRETVAVVQRQSLLGRIGSILRGRYRPWMWISGFSFDHMSRNLHLVNSHWSARKLRALYPGEPRTLYPPVIWTRPVRDWQSREDRFIVVGRMDSAKRQVEAIDIIERVRSRGHDVTLHIVGDAHCPEYTAAVHRRAEAAGSWVQIDHGLSRQELEQAIDRCRYGLHAMLEEHFGMAVGELVRGGCIVFVPNGGGQVEIVGEQCASVYSSDDDAVDRICRALEDPDHRLALRNELRDRGGQLGEQRFMDEFRDAVRTFHRQSVVEQGSKASSQ